MNDWIFVLPFLCGALWAAGGRPHGRWCRRLFVGIVVSIACFSYLHNSIVCSCVLTYYIVTSIGYGKWIKRRNWWAIAVIGASYGIAAWPIAVVVNTHLIMLQTLVASLVFTGLTYFSNTGCYRLHWALVEGFTGIGATIVIPFMVCNVR